MTAKQQFILLFTVLFVGVGVLLYLVFEEQKIYFVMSELLLLGLIAWGAKVYQRIFQPIQLLQRGAEALKDEDFNVKFQKTGSGDMDNLVTVYNKMIDKIRRERVYQQEQHFFLEEMLDALPVGIIILDFDGQFSNFNRYAEELLGLGDQYIGQAVDRLQHPIAPLLAQLKNKDTQVYKQGSIDYYRCTANRFMHRGFPRKFIVIEELSADILRTEKQAYGKVIRMMSHEVNNSIGAINSILHSLLSQTPVAPEEVGEYLPIVIERNDRLNQFMKNFAKVIRLPEPDKRPLELTDLLQDLVRLVAPQCEEKGVRLHYQPGVERFPIQADRQQLEQAIINVLKNSLEAIPAEGNITIQLQTERPQLIITDDGAGISPDISDKLFTPFFSTKPTGQGVGLTLVRDILYQHGYEFELYSEEGLTYFTVSF